SQSVDDEQLYFYGFMPRCAPQATDPENASGMSVSTAWQNFGSLAIGAPSVVIAYIEAGINWHHGDAQELANKVYLNRGELPPPLCDRSPCVNPGSYDHQNDPATYDSAYGHANNQQKQAAAETDNGIEGAGLCSGCLLLPIKAGAEALDRDDDLAQAWLFAVDSGASVITSVTADLGYTTFMRQAVEYAWRHGIVMAESSNDFDSTDHQGSLFWPHVL